VLQETVRKWMKRGKGMIEIGRGKTGETATENEINFEKIMFSSMEGRK